MADMYDAPDGRFSGFQHPEWWAGWDAPWLSQDVAEIADAANFYPVETGGGCTALQHDLDGAYLLVTDDAAIPENPYSEVTLGLFDESGEMVGYQEFANLSAALADVDGFVARANGERVS